MDYGQYLDQITYLLFLKMASTKAGGKAGSAWSLLEEQPVAGLTSVYETLLGELGSAESEVSAIFAGARSEFASDASLRTLMTELNSLEWESLERDVQADAFEYLLDQAASEGKKGAGQYFTPRVLTKAIVACLKPGYFEGDSEVLDPAAGTGGFLIAAHEWLVRQSGTSTKIKYRGNELVQRPRRLALMNGQLHDIRDFAVTLGDALQSPASDASRIILANPPFGSQGHQIPDRKDFWFRTTNKQANFVQHIVQSLGQGGRAAIVVPDSSLFGETARGLLPEMLRRCKLHTVLRLPDGTFAPYTAGTKTNVLFLSNENPSSDVWIYDARSRESAGRKPLGATELAEFVDVYGPDAHGRSPRSESQSPSKRWTKFTAGDVEQVQYELDRLEWRSTAEDVSVPESEELLREARDQLDVALRSLERLQSILVDNDA